MIVVTGGAGFIGSNLVAGLQDHGVGNIVVCDVLGTEDKWRNIAKRELCDIVRPEALFGYLDGHADEVEAIFHMGAVSSTAETDVDLVIEKNFTTSRKLWNWCSAHSVRFIYASSAATYGDGSAGFKDDAEPDALAKLRPLNPYGWSKHLFDRRTARVAYDTAMAAYDDEHADGRTLPPQWAGLKFFNVYGPNEYHKGNQKSVVCHLYPQINTASFSKLFKSYHPDYEDGCQMRDFIYVDDCVSVMLWLYDNPGISGIYNVGTGKARSFNDLAGAVFAALDKKTNITYIDMPDELKDKYQYFTEADMAKLRKRGYDKPFTSLEEGVRKYVQGFLAADDRYR